MLETRHQNPGSFSEGPAAAWSDDAYGFINKAGRWAVEPRFDQVEPFHDGLAEVRRDDWKGLIDKTGEFVWGPTREGESSSAVDLEWTA